MRSKNIRTKRFLSSGGILLILLLPILVGCSFTPTVNPEESNPEATKTLPPPGVDVTTVPDAEMAARTFLENYRAGEFEKMYTMLSDSSMQNISQEQFVVRYEDVMREAAVSEILYEIYPGLITPRSADLSYQITLHSAVVGDITRAMQMHLNLENGAWRVEWNDSSILPELANGNYLSMDADIPIRASIYDRNGNALAAQTEAVAIGLYPDFVDLSDDQGLLGLLSVLTNYKSYSLAGMIEEAEPGAYIALGEIAADQDARRLEILSTYGAVRTSVYTSRLYFGSGVAPHVVGYVSAIQEDELEEYRRQGYRSDERVGRKGIELWGEDVLSGVRGGALYVFSPEGKPIAQLGSVASKPGQDIHSTIDLAFQREAQKAMSVFRGAAVAIELDTGRVLAMVSTPGFDQNAFEFENFNWSILLDDIVNDPDLPQFNRASQGQYPLGSVFKVMTLGAALESGIFTAESEYNCGYFFEELPGLTLQDWTYDHFLEDEITRPSGLLTLKEGLIRSCNPFFWHMGLHLYQRGLSTAVSDMARGFGLGGLTGIEGVVEEAGNIPDPQSEIDATNLAIGQGETLVTPLQVARFTAALGNGGVLYRPQLIEKIVPASGIPSFEFQPENQGSLPLSPENLALIQEAMLGVIRNQNPVGTAYSAFTGMDLNVAGKTGTAETSGGAESHAWFAGYTFEGREDIADIAVVVIAENAGEGSQIAAPIFRRIIELYFYGAPRKLYRWEANFDVTRSPTLPVTPTATLQLFP